MALYLIFGALAELSYVPVDAFALSHYQSLQSGGQSYSHTYYLILLIRHVSYMALLLAASVWLYRCGATVSGFLSPPEE